MRSRAQLLRLFRKHWGESARLARELELKPATVSRWFQGHFDSDRIEAAVVARAKELIERDTRRKAADERLRRELANAQSAGRREVQAS